MRKVAFEDRLIQFLSQFKFLNVNNYFTGMEFFTHFLLHAVIAFFILSLPLKNRIRWAFLSLIFALNIELINDRHYLDLFSATPEGADGRTDLISRSLGACFPFIVLIFPKLHEKTRSMKLLFSQKLRKPALIDHPK